RAPAAQRELLPALDALLHPQAARAGGQRDLDLPTALCDRLRHPGAQVEIVALAREVGVRADRDREERIARAASVAEIVPLAGEAQHVAVGDAARDRHDHTARTHRAGRSVTGRARFAPRAALA